MNIKTATATNRDVIFTDEADMLLAQKLSFWDKLSPHERESFVGAANTLRKEAGSLFNDGERDCTGLLIVKSGTLRVCLISDEGREITLYRVKGGEVCVMSASCILSHISFVVNIYAESNCELISISADVLSKIMRHNVSVECFTYKKASERLSDVMWVLQQRLFMRLDRRLASFLLTEAESKNSDRVRMTHEQIAAEVGSSREVVTRMLKNFADDGMTELLRGEVRIIAPDELRGLI